MTSFAEILLAVLLLTDLSLLVSSRLLHCIRLVALQGVVIGVFPLTVWNWSQGTPSPQVFLIAVLSLFAKAILLPKMLRRSMYKAKVRRELEPLVGYSKSLVIFLAVTAVAFCFCGKYLVLPEETPVLCAPVAIITIFSGLFVIIARKKALTQAIGFLVFENGITAFGMGMMLEYGIVVELGILLDVFVLVFVMGISIFNINRAFSNIDVDEMHLLNDDDAHQGGEK